MTGAGSFFTGHLCTVSVKQGRLNTEMGHLFPTGASSIARALPSRLQRPIQNDHSRMRRALPLMLRWAATAN